MNLTTLRVLDESKMLADLEAYAEHWIDATRIGDALELTRSLEGAREIVWTGMGGSAVGGDILQAVAGDHLSIPLSVNRGYRLPKFAGKGTLVIAASYSGNTEETLSVVDEALERGAKLLCISTGGQLLNTFREAGLPHLAIPGGMQPRVGLIQLFLPVMMVLARLGYIDPEAIKPGHEETGQKLREWATEFQAEDNAAILLADQLHHLLPVMYASNHLEPVLIRWRAQINENAKSLAYYHVLPEMNHNEIVGWYHPVEVIKRSHVLFLRDRDELAPVARRLDITEQMLRSEGGAKRVTTLWSRGESRMARIFSLIVLGDFMSYYLALINGADPSPVDRIQRFKKILAGD